MAAATAAPLDASAASLGRCSVGRSCPQSIYLFILPDRSRDRPVVNDLAVMEYQAPLAEVVQRRKIVRCQQQDFRVIDQLRDSVSGLFDEGCVPGADHLVHQQDIAAD